jgi:hypothetical protein
MFPSPSLLTLQLLSWITSQPRSYAEARQAWRSTCPTTCAWEDAISEGLIEFETGSGRITGDTAVRLSASGRAALQAAGEVQAPAALDIAAQ